MLIHGDAAFAGQGVVMELFQMSQARGFAVGGTVHVVINNQVGFTTSAADDARSTLYCTDVAKMVGAPVLHVNGDDPEAVVFCAELAFDFRQRFGKDVVIDLVCYRRHGHNEADEPAATQPLMYQKIRAHKTTRELYGDRLVAEGVLAADAVQGAGRRLPRQARRRRSHHRSGRRQAGRIRGRLVEVPQRQAVRPGRHAGRPQRARRARRADQHDPRRHRRCIRAWPRSTKTAARWRPANCRATGASPRTSPTRRC